MFKSLLGDNVYVPFGVIIFSPPHVLITNAPNYFKNAFIVWPH